MKKLILCIVLFVGCTIIAHAQWTRLDLPPGQYRDIFFSAEKTGFLVGDSGMVLKTVDDGATWRKIDVGVNANLKSVHFPSSNVGYIVGDSIFFKTIDGGETWTVRKDSIFRGMNRVNFFSEILGFVEHQFFGTIKTNDGGSTWTLFSDLTDFGIVSDGFSYATNEGHFLKSLDSTNTWEKTYSYIGLPVWYMVVRFADANNGVAGCGPGLGLGQAGFVHTSDGGKTWKSLVLSGWMGQKLKDSSGNIGKGIIDVFFASSTVGYALADSKITTQSDYGILKTRNSGADWTFLKIDTTLHFYSNVNSKIYFQNENVGYIIDGKVLKTTTGGEEPVSVQEPLLKTISTNISPNPFKNSARIELPGNLLQPEIRIFTANGEDCTDCFKIEVFENSVTLERISASAGAYYFTIKSEGKIIAEGKFVVE